MIRKARSDCLDGAIIKARKALSSKRIDNYSPDWYSSSMLVANDNRPYPPPSGPWVMAMTWRHLLFAHWPVPEDVLRSHIPDQLRIDLFEGQAWLGIVPFEMRDTRPRWLPAVPYLAHFPELNVRTYVISGGKPGVWFFSLDAARWLAVRGARAFFHLPYYDARMKLHLTNAGGVCYESTRVHRGALPARLRADYRPVGETFVARRGSLESWLTDRYCLYSANRRGTLFRGEIHHAPWPLQLAEAQWSSNTMTEQLGFPLPEVAPLLHFSRSIEVVGWPLERVC